jgi:xanthine dehydrogenase iron-sulfur cluster and FAD-binding subunit A
VNGAAWNADTIDSACDALARDFSPITDMRASADMRLVAVQNLLRRFWLETSGEARLVVVQNLLRRFWLETSGEAPQTVYTYGR